MKKPMATARRSSQTPCYIQLPALALLLWVFTACLDPIAAKAGPFDANFSAPMLQAQDLVNLSGPRVALQTDGKILIHGFGFNMLGGTETGPLARFNTDGTLDSRFAFSRDYSSAFSIAPLTNGQLIVNASLASFAGDYEELLRVNPDGSADGSFSTGIGANGNIRAISAQPDGKVLVGGLFTTFNGNPYPYLVRLNTNGSIDPTFGPISLATNTNNGFSTGIWSPIIVQPDGKVIVGGVFGAVNGTLRDGLVRLNPNGSVDKSFVPTGFSESRGPVRGLGFQSNGLLVVGGRFSLGTNSTRRPLVRVNANGVADATFVTSSIGPGRLIRDLKILPDDCIVAVDDKVYRFNADGTADAGFAPDLLTDKDGNTPLVATVGVQSDGKVVFAGSFSFVGSQRRNGVARVYPNGSLDSFDIGTVQLERFPQEVAVQKDGRILIASDFEDANDLARPGLARFNRDGTLDQTFDPAAALGTNVSILGAVLQPDDRVFVAILAGSFGTTNLARLNPDGTLDTSFNAGNSPIEFGNAFPLADGRVLLLAANNPDLLASHNSLISRLNADGSFDASFQLDPSLNQAVIDSVTREVTVLYAPGPKPLLELPGGKLLVAWMTTNLQFKLGRLNSDGSLDTGFTAGVVPEAMPFSSSQSFLFDPFSGQYYLAPFISAEHLAFFDAALHADGKLLVVGQFTNYNGSEHNGIVRLNPDGTIDSTFSPGTGPQWVSTIQTGTNLFPRIESVRLLSGNKILIAGNFEAFSGAPFNGLARLNSDGSVDTNFFSGLVRRNFALFPRAPGALVQQPDGNFLLAGQFSRIGQPDVLTVSRILMRPSLEIQKAAAANSVQLNLTGGADRIYTIQTSTNLVDWRDQTTIISTNEVNSFAVSPLIRGKFYRAAVLP